MDTDATYENVPVHIRARSSDPSSAHVAESSECQREKVGKSGR